MDFNTLWTGFEHIAGRINLAIWNTLWKSDLADTYMGAQKVAASDFGVTYQMNPRQVIDYYKNHGLELVKTLNDTDKTLFKELIEKHSSLPFPQFRERLGESFASSDARAKMIYDNEKHNAMTIGYDDYTRAYIEKTGAKIYKTWHRGNSVVPREDHLIEGETVPFEDSFSNGLMVPEGINCQCWLTYSKKTSSI
jgi:hypothetical protein